MRHPGPLENPLKKLPGESEDFLLNKLQKVSLVDTVQNEWWTLRRVPSTITDSSPELSDGDKCEAYNKSYAPPSSYKSKYSDSLDESSSFKTNIEGSFNKYGKRLSEASTSKLCSKRMSVDSDLKANNESNKLQFGKLTIRLLILNTFSNKNHIFQYLTNVLLEAYPSKQNQILIIWKMNYTLKATQLFGPEVW